MVMEFAEKYQCSIFAVLIELYLSEFTLYTKNTLSTQKSQFKFLGSVEYCTLKF